MNKFALILSFGLFYNVQAQNRINNYEIGHFVDFNGHAIDGFYDFNYQPDKSLQVSYTIGQDFTPGYYYDHTGNKISGLIKYLNYNTYFKFKATKDEKARTIKPVDCVGYVIGVDSFAVIENFDVQRDLGAFPINEPEFVEVVDQVQGSVFYKHTNSNDFVITYIVKTNSSSVYRSFPKGMTKFKKIASEVFSAFPALRENIEKGKYRSYDIPIMIKLLKYKNLYEHKNKIYFNSSWEEIDAGKEYAYYATITSLQDTVFHLVYYFNNQMKIYEGDFTSFYPHNKRGEFIFYYPSGLIRKRTFYVDYKPENEITYFANGNLHFEYEFTDEGITYEKVCDRTGKNILNETGSAKQRYYDSVANREIYYEFENYKLNNSYYLTSNGKKIFLHCETMAKLRGLKSLQSIVRDELNYPAKTVKNYNHGYVLIKCIVEPSGLVSNAQVVKGIDADCDAMILNWFSLFKIRPYWTSGKQVKERIAQELIVPIDFSIKGFSRYRTNYNNMNWMQNNMWQQNMMPNVTPPAMPNSFR